MRLSTVILRSVSGLLASYVAFLAVICHPRVQVALVTLNWVKWPLFAKFSQPERFGYGVGRVRNLYINTNDGAKLGSWLALAESPWERLRDKFGGEERFSDGDVNFAFQQRPTVLYLHGNAATRAQSIRLTTVKSLLSLDVNVLIVDYRGFADSSSMLPDEAGLNVDARAAWNWLAARTSPESIAICAQSLGTGIASQLASSLASEGVTPRAIILVAPFTSIAELLQTYRLFKLVPMLGLIRWIPGAETLLNRFLTFHFQSAEVLPNVKSPILLAHARDDGDIYYKHSASLFETLFENSKASSTVHTQRIGYEEETRGSISTFSRAGAGNVTHLELAHGGHNAVGYADETRRLIRKVLEV